MGIHTTRKLTNANNRMFLFLNYNELYKYNIYSLYSLLSTGGNIPSIYRDIVHYVNYKGYHRWINSVGIF
jgi:hypothetical protein